MAETESPIYKIPDHLLTKIEDFLAKKSYSFSRPDAIARSVEQLSEFYIKNPSKQTPWDKEYAQVAYLSYYLPLNYIRSLHCVDRLKQIGFFDGLKTTTEFGSGNGALSLALQDRNVFFDRYICIERSELAIEQHKKLQSKEFAISWMSEAKVNKELQSDLSSFCYSFTEQEVLPEFAQKSEAILIVEPSTHQDSRRLMQLRQKLIEEKYQIWAPCTHQKSCPLLSNSEKDWCHDRVVFELPEYMKKLNAILPFKIASLAYSYLALRKDNAPEVLNSLARVTGDPLDENGKRRQLLCRGEEREFLSWFTKREKTPEIKRGSLVQLPEQMIKKSNELRSLGEMKLIESSLVENK